MSNKCVNAADPESLIACVVDSGDQAQRIMKALSDCGYRIVKDVRHNEALLPGFDQRSYDLGYMEGENSAEADREFGGLK